MAAVRAKKQQEKRILEIQSLTVTIKRKEVSYPLNGSLLSKNWKVIGQAGNVLTYGIAPGDLTSYNLFMYRFSLPYLSVIVSLTNIGMEGDRECSVTKGENPMTKYGPFANSGRFVSRQRLENILKKICFRLLAKRSNSLDINYK